MVSAQLLAGSSLHFAGVKVVGELEVFEMPSCKKTVITRLKLLARG